MASDLDPAVIGIGRLGALHLAGRRIVEERRHRFEYGQAVVLESEQVVAAALPHEGSRRALAIERIRGHERTGEVEAAEPPSTTWAL